MDLSNILEHYLKQSPCTGEWAMAELIDEVARSRYSGIACCRHEDDAAFLLFVKGEPEGAIWQDPKGVLYGNKAVYHMKQQDRFSLFSVEEEAVRKLAMVCGILDRNLLSSGSSREIPIFNTDKGGVGVLVITVQRDGATVSGLHISVHKQGHVVGSGVTDNNGTISFRLLHGEYSCTVLDSGRVLRSYPIALHSPSSNIILELPSRGSSI